LLAWLVGCGSLDWTCAAFDAGGPPRGSCDAGCATGEGFGGGSLVGWLNMSGTYGTAGKGLSDTAGLVGLGGVTLAGSVTVDKVGFAGAGLLGGAAVADTIDLGGSIIDFEGTTLSVSITAGKVGFATVD
jgi:hypothetical protein